MISVAPMMDWTDRHCRYFLRLISPSIRLYTEMLTVQALHHGDADELLRFHPREHPLALQLGGSDPQLMTNAARLGAAAGYDEVNINVGCPSDRVQSGQFGACLMATPGIVAECVSAMTTAVDIPVTVKTRIGIDDWDSFRFLESFVGRVAEAGCRRLVIHARIAILQGLSPKENRSVPPLNYARVYRLKDRFPDLEIVLNGGIQSLDECREHLRYVDGIMIGRKAYQDPWFLAQIEAEFGSLKPLGSRLDVLEEMLPYIANELANGVQLKHITRHMLGLFAGQRGARAWRRALSENAHRPGAGIEVIEQAISRLPMVA